VANEAASEQAFELLQELKLFQFVKQFFDRASYFAAIGYERYQAAHPEATGLQRMGESAVSS
jgi:hypothetical protein